MLRRLYRASIWARGSIPAGERKYAGPLKWFVFPAFDIAMVLLGSFGLASQGFKAIALTFPPPIPAVLYGTLIVSGVLCFGGCVFPRFWPVEIAGKSVILAALFVLIAAMLVAAAEIPGHTGVMISVLLGVASLFSMLRLWILGVEIADRRA
jgi:hypothetical protein